MRIEYRLPALGADMETGTIVEWHVQPGGRVKRGDVVAVVETDKGAIDVEIFEDGVVAELLVPPGVKVPVGTPLALIDVESAAGAAQPERERPPVTPATIVPPPVATTAAPAQPPAPRRPHITPAARERARQLGIDVATIEGTGPDGAVTCEDVDRAAAGAAARPAPAAAGEGAAPAPTAGQTMRDAIAASMSRSKREIPHYYLSATADVTPAVDWLARHNASVPVTERLLFAALLVKAVAFACAAAPGFSGFYRGGRYEEAPVVHVGVAVAIRGGGLVAPAILDTATKPLPLLMQEFRDLVARARAGRLKASELAAPTIILTSLGDSPVDTVLPVIQPPQVAIVGAGAVQLRPWMLDGQIVARQLCTLSLAADHRVTDGRLGAQFLGRIARLLAEPEAPPWRAP